HLRLHHLAAAEGQKLAGQNSRAVGGVQYLLHARAQLMPFTQIVQHHAAVAADYGEQVVEVVRHAAGQPADGFHLLRLAELLFQLPALGDIDTDAAEESSAAAAVGN